MARVVCYTTVLCVHTKSYILDQIAPLFATSGLDHCEARNDEGHRVKTGLQNECDETAPF